MSEQQGQRLRVQVGAENAKVRIRGEPSVPLGLSMDVAEAGGDGVAWAEVGEAAPVMEDELGAAIREGAVDVFLPAQTRYLKCPKHLH